MIKKPPRGLFVTGTDTEIGKTYVSALIAKALVEKGHRVGVYKPVSTDCIREAETLMSVDAITLWKASGKPLDLESVCPQRFEAPLSPNQAAAKEGRTVNSQLLRSGLAKWCDHCDVIVVEGVGGLMSPIADDEFVADLAYDIGYPLVVVSPNVLGTINHTLQTLITAATFKNGLPVAGIVLNNPGSTLADESAETNREQIERNAVSPVLTDVKYEANDFSTAVDWFELADADPQLREDEDW